MQMREISSRLWMQLKRRGTKSHSRGNSHGILGPFVDKEELELAKWLIKNIGHNQAEAFLKLPIINRVKPLFNNKWTFLESIDRLPITAGWNIKHIPVTSDILDENGKLRMETAELWFWDLVECMKELIGNPSFKDVMDYAPKRLASAGWWWKIQLHLPKGSTCAPIILSSDKTRLSQQRGDKTAWLVYLTIGNIVKDTRRKASSHTTILLGYLPTPKLDCFSNTACSVAKYCLFHYCMGLIMESLADVGTNGIHMTCTDRFVCHVHPILAAYVTDYPEQRLAACCMENRCPECKVLPTECAQIQEDTRPAPGPPFWAGLPHTDIFEAFTLDILHQLHNGIFKDHLVSWCTTVIGESEMDTRFKSMPSHPDWTGSEHKEMEKLFAGLMAGHAEPTDIFIEFEVCSQGHFNIPKIHWMEHYTPKIRLFSSTDGFNMEVPEWLHIDYTKAGYRVSNKKVYITQMTLWLQRQEAIDRFTAYFAWCKDTKAPTISVYKWFKWL
ncbi:hypothetical protein B0H10DRAFT_2176477 [Mycena sp. CBHHK59/15]|nr:hypothetical protein B0H10DRAFT_2176477 [Mycena sp. CBHHK59/15]